MSNPESFIDEVTEEVRRDKLYAKLRKYGWIGVLAVLLLVGGAALNEWMKASARSAAEATGDAILAAVSLDEPDARVTALGAVEAEGDGAALIALLAAAEGASPEDAASQLAAIEANAELPQLYRDLAALKRATIPAAPMPAPERIAVLEPLTAPGAPFRVLADEQIALAEIELGENDAALARLQALLNDTEASGALRRRATQLIVALGGTPGDGS